MSSARVHPFSEVLDAFRAGRPVIMTDDEERENEGDLVIASEKVTAEGLAFLMAKARGLVCTTISHELAARLNLPLQALNNSSPFHTPFAVSVDAREVAPVGVTAEARATTIRRLIDPDAGPDDFVTPGHIFPLIASPLGVIGRQGQTEGSFDLARIAGLTPSAVICEILNPDGTMARGAELEEFAARYDLKVTSVREVLRYRVEKEILVRELARSSLETPHGTFQAHVMVDDVERKEHIALIYGNPAEAAARGKPIIVRIHSECLTGDVFGSRRCDCGAQLSLAMAKVAEAQHGIILYLRQEGRGIGLTNKLRAYALQDQGHDTVEANLALGFKPDLRDFAVAAKILSHFGVNQVELMTNNPEKIKTLERFGVEVKGRIAVIAPEDEFSKDYLRTKREKLGHLF